MPIGRFEMFARLGRVTTAESMFDTAAKSANEREWRESLHSAPHGEPWFSSFHTSAFPAGDERACARKALYSMMGFPNVEPASRMLSGTAIMGDAAERWNALNLDLDGRVLSVGAVAGKKVQLTDHDHWLTGSPDFIVLPPFWNRPHLIETKSKDMDVLVQMKALGRSYDAAHARQCRGYVGLAHHASRQLWPDVVVCQRTWRIAEAGNEPVIDAMVCPDHGIHADSGCLTRVELESLRTGSLIYMARDRPHTTSEYVFEHDEDWFQSGLAKLAQWRAHFEAGELPPHPFGGKQWSEQPCRFCDLKKTVCKPDHQAGVTKLSESRGVEWAKQVYGPYAYTPEKIIAAVIERWAGKSGVEIKLAQNNGN